MRIFWYFYLPWIGKLTQGATLIGLMDKFQVLTDWGRIGEFCFTIPPGSRGIIESEIAVETDGHYFLLVKDDEVSEILQNKALRSFQIPDTRNLMDDASNTYRDLLDHDSSETGPTNSSSATLSPPIVRFEKTFESQKGITAGSEMHIVPGRPRLEVVSNTSVVSTVNGGAKNIENMSVKRGAPIAKPDNLIEIVDTPGTLSSSITSVCEALLAKARVRESLAFQHHPTVGLATYDLLLWVQPHVNMHRVSAIITRCGALPNAQYRIQLKNPGGIFRAHFSCHDQGLLQIYIVLAIASVLCSVPLLKLWKSLSHARREHPVVAVLFLGSCAFFVSTLLTFLHFLAYAFDGLGLSVLLFVGALSDLTFVVAICFVICYLLLDRQYPILLLFLCATLDIALEMEESDERRSFTTNEANTILQPPRFKTNVNETRLFPQVGSSSSLRDYFRINFNAFPDLLRHLARPIFLLFTLAFAALFYTLLASLKVAYPGEPLSPIAKLLHWRRKHGISSFSDGLLTCATVLYLVCRTLLAAILLHRLLKSKRKKSERNQKLHLSCIIWLSLPPLFAFFWFDCTGFFLHIPLISIQVANMWIFFALAYYIREESDNGQQTFQSMSYRNIKNTIEPLERQRLVVGGDTSSLRAAPIGKSSTLHTDSRNPVFPTPSWEIPPEDEPELIDVTIPNIRIKQ